MLFYFACEAAGASSTRHSPRPLIFRWRYTIQNSRASRGEVVEVCVVTAKMDTHVLQIIRAVMARSERDQSNPGFLFGVGSMDCFAPPAMRAQIDCAPRCRCRRYRGIGGLHPSPESSWGGWHIVSRANDVTGGGRFRCARVTPTRHIVRAAHDGPPKSELRSSRPHEGRSQAGRG